jgi:hypothetical protein
MRSITSPKPREGRILRLTKPTIRALLFFSMMGMGILTLATGLMLMSHGRPAGGLTPGELAFSAPRDGGGFVELHPAVAFITAVLVMAHLLLNSRAIYSYARAMISS